MAFGSQMGKFLMGNMTALFEKLGNSVPTTGFVLTSAKCGARAGRAYRSFVIGGPCNPCFYLNCVSSGLAFSSLACRVGSAAVPGMAVPLYSAAVCLGETSDAIDDCVTITGIIL